MNEKVKYWLDLSDYDYETAVAMQKSGLKNTNELSSWIKAKF